jgi:hypothetical protein
MCRGERSRSLMRIGSNSPKHIASRSYPITHTSIVLFQSTINFAVSVLIVPQTRRRCKVSSVAVSNQPCNTKTSHSDNFDTQPIRFAVCRFSSGNVLCSLLIDQADGSPFWQKSGNLRSACSCTGVGLRTHIVWDGSFCMFIVTIVSTMDTCTRIVLCSCF